MSRNVDHGRMRQVLLDSAINVVAKYGMESCTSKKIASESHLNEAYIFRYYTDLCDLRAKAFESVVRKWMNHLELLKEAFQKDFDDGETEKQYLTEFWNMLESSPSEVKFFIRYYHSEEFDEMLNETGDKEYLLMNSKFFPDNSKNFSCNTVILESLLTIAEYMTLIFRELLPNNSDTLEKVFKILYI